MKMGQSLSGRAMRSESPFSLIEIQHFSAVGFRHILDRSSFEAVPKLSRIRSVPRLLYCLALGLAFSQCGNF